jgi:hypothetical protein
VPSAVISADLAADLTVPWRRPTTAIVWTRHRVDLESSGLVAAESKGAASIIVRTTDDDRMLAEAELVDGLPLAPRLQLAADLIDLGGRRPGRGGRGAPRRGAGKTVTATVVLSLDGVPARGCHGVAHRPVVRASL